MSAVQRIVQNATVRVIASELDRRALEHNRAIQDLQTQVGDLHRHIARLDELSAARDALLKNHFAELQTVRANLAVAQERIHDRLNIRIDQAATRLNGADDAIRVHAQELSQLRFDLEAARRSLADLTGVLERLTLPG